MLYGRRKRLRELAEAEKAGRALWTDKLDQAARYKLLYEIQDFVEDTDHRYGMDLLAVAQRQAVKELGLGSLAGRPSDPRLDLLQAVMQAEEEVVFTALEAVLLVGELAGSRTIEGVSWEDRQRYETRLPGLRATISTVLREHWVKVGRVNNSFVDFESQVMHEDVVVPALTLLGGTRGFELADKAFTQALKELHEGTPEDAITDAATALQEALGFLGAQGNTVSKKIDSAVSMGLLAPYDRHIGQWLEADRSNKGDAHNAAAAARADAWLAVHVVAAFLVRLLDPARRG